MQLYVDGFNDNDVGSSKAFHDDAGILYVDADGRLTKNLISESFAHWAAPPSWGVVGRIVLVTQVGDVASVQIVWDRTLISPDVWIDFHNLIKIDGIGRSPTRPLRIAASETSKRIRLWPENPWQPLF